jgi:hypothetical protein
MKLLEVISTRCDGKNLARLFIENSYYILKFGALGETRTLNPCGAGF